MNNYDEHGNLIEGLHTVRNAAIGVGGLLAAHHMYKNRHSISNAISNNKALTLAVPTMVIGGTTVYLRRLGKKIKKEKKRKEKNDD